MPNQIAAIKNYTNILDTVYQKASVSGCLASGGRMVRAGKNAKEIMVPKITVSGLGDYTRNVGYKTGSISFDYETMTFNYDRGIKLLADVMDVEGGGRAGLLRGGGLRAHAHTGGAGGRRLHVRRDREARGRLGRRVFSSRP